MPVARSAARPGRSCPRSYFYGPQALAGEACLRVDSLWVAGGLYGNPFALDALLEAYDREGGVKALVFNGDFHWVDIDPVKVAIEDERLAAALAVVSLEQGVEGERVAIQPARHPQRIDIQACLARESLRPVEIGARAASAGPRHAKRDGHAFRRSSRAAQGTARRPPSALPRAACPWCRSSGSESRRWRSRRRSRRSDLRSSACAVRRRDRP